MESTVATAIGTGVTTVTGAFTSITGWWVLPVAVGFFVAGLCIKLVMSFFGKRKGKKRR